MSVIVSVTIPAEEFVLGRTLSDHEGLRIKVERMIPFGEGPLPCFWLRGLAAKRAERVLERDEMIERATVLDQMRDAVLVRVAWADDAETPFDTFVATAAIGLEATVYGDVWRLKLRFPSREALSIFYRKCAARDIPLTVRSVHDRVAPEGDDISDVLSERQYETLRAAFENGYFSIPRGITLQELAEQLDISDTAVSQRLRRGMRKILAEELPVTA